MDISENDSSVPSLGGSLPIPGDSGITPSANESKQQNPTTQHQMKLIKPLLSSASRLGKALAELFGLLVKVHISI